MCYSPKLNQFAYACSDTMCYIRKFSKHGPEMKLINTLQGHLSEVNCIKWLEGNITCFSQKRLIIIEFSKLRSRLLDHWW